MVSRAIKRIGLFRTLWQGVISTEEWFFDKWHNVETTMGRRPAVRGSVNFYYEPTRPARMRSILTSVPLDYPQYVFVDFGSGKGRPMLIAAEFPFRSVQGVELDEGLHNQALRNIENLRRLPVRAGRIESLCLNATEYVFPETPLFLYFYNPFGQPVMEKILSTLAKSLERNPRDVVIAMLLPEFAYVVDQTPAFKLDKVVGGCHIYRSQPIA